MRVQVNPDVRPNGKPLAVRRPGSDELFPPKPFELSPAELADPKILRLLPRSVPGGCFGDLVPVEDAPAKGADRQSEAASKKR